MDSDETQFVSDCPHVVTEVVRRRRSSVELVWTAPPPGAGCIEFRSVSLEGDWKCGTGKCPNGDYVYVYIYIHTYITGWPKK